MKKTIFAAALILLGTVSVCPVSRADVPAKETSPAYQKYQNRPKTELSKLIYLMDYFRGTEYKVVYDKMEYDSTTALQTAKNYIAKHYTNENALTWVKEHSYRSAGGQIIYLKSPDGKSETLRDALVRQLQVIG